jgi:phage terminase small subunit
MSARKGKPPAKSVAKFEPPEELAGIWDKDIHKAFMSLNPRQQKFIVVYAKEQVGSEAYRQAYNESASDKVASVCGSQLMANPSIRSIMERLSESSIEDLFIVKKALRDAATTAVKPIYGKDELNQPVKIEDLPDHDVRIKAASAMAKLHGFNAPDKVDVKTNNPTIPTNFTVNFNHFLQQHGAKPIELPMGEVEDAESTPAAPDSDFSSNFKEFAGN